MQAFCDSACQWRHLRWELLGTITMMAIAITVVFVVGRITRPKSSIQPTLNEEQQS